MDVPSAQERAFISEYLRTGNGARAAVAAGYAKSAARQTAYKLLGRQRVKDEIARRANMAPEAAVAEDDDGSRSIDQVIRITARMEGGRKPPPPLEGEVHGREPEQAGSPYNPRRLSRDWIVERLMKTALICLGELPSIETRVVTRTAENGKVLATAVLVEGYSFNPAGVIGATAGLFKEMDRRDGLLPGDSAAALPPHRADFEKRIGEFAATVRKRLAEQAERAARFNATSPGAVGTNGGKTTE